MAMVDLGADPARIVAAIGPTISGANYEVGPEFAADLLGQTPRRREAASPDPTAAASTSTCPASSPTSCAAPASASSTTSASAPTPSPDRYFSHRYATHQGTTTGRQIAIIGLALTAFGIQSNCAHCARRLPAR